MVAKKSANRFDGLLHTDVQIIMHRHTHTHLKKARNYPLSSIETIYSQINASLAMSFAKQKNTLKSLCRYTLRRRPN